MNQVDKRWPYLFCTKGRHALYQRHHMKEMAKFLHDEFLSNSKTVYKVFQFTYKNVKLKY